MICVRPALLGDLEAMLAVSVRNGLSSFDPVETRNWWLSHPFRAEFEGVPIGWVLESETDGIVGTFSNVHMMYELDGRRFKCGIAGSWGVDSAHRNSSLLLVMSYFRQKGVDLCLNGSAGAIASRVMPALKIPRIASADYDLSYFWITRPRAFAEAVLRKKKIPAAGILSVAAALVLRAGDLRTGGRSRNLATVKPVKGFGDEFDAFWEKIRQGRGRLRAVRSSAALEWRFGGSLRQNRATVLGTFQGGRLGGYVVLRQSVREHLGLRQFVIADLQALDDSPDVILDLLAGALEATRQENLDALEWQGWSPAKRQVARSLHPKSYRYPVWPLYYKAVNPDLVPLLAGAGSWDFSPFDAF
jgi:hypothetical protein